MPTFAKAMECLPRNVRLLDGERLDCDASALQKQIALFDRMHSDLAFENDREFDKIGGADSATIGIVNGLNVNIRPGLPEKYGGKGGRIQNHFGRPSSSYRNSA